MALEAASKGCLDFLMNLLVGGVSNTQPQFVGGGRCGDQTPLGGRHTALGRQGVNFLPQNWGWHRQLLLYIYKAL